MPFPQVSHITYDCYIEKYWHLGLFFSTRQFCWNFIPTFSQIFYSLDNLVKHLKTIFASFFHIYSFCLHVYLHLLRFSQYWIITVTVKIICTEILTRMSLLQRQMFVSHILPALGVWLTFVGRGQAGMVYTAMCQTTMKKTLANYLFLSSAD